MALREQALFDHVSNTIDAASCILPHPWDKQKKTLAQSFVSIRICQNMTPHLNISIIQTKDCANVFSVFPVCIFLAAQSAAASSLYGGERELALVKPPYKLLTMPQGQEKTNGVIPVFCLSPANLKMCIKGRAYFFSIFLPLTMTRPL